MIDFTKVKSISIPEGGVRKITDSAGNVLWQKGSSVATITINVKATPYTNYGSYAFGQAQATIGDITYGISERKYTSYTVEVPVGTVISCVAYWDEVDDEEGGGEIYLNGVVVASGRYSKATYDYTVTGNAVILLENVALVSEDFMYSEYEDCGYIYITEG